ncbi:MAG: DUF2384 domain-containing protein [Alphaproteobacteria bacterium]|nr:DUF2384 domain-containing protein [Alphaproteobacteria bacterium]
MALSRSDVLKDLARSSPPVALARIMGFTAPQTYDRVKLADAIAAGVSVRSAEQVCHWIDPDGVRLRVVDVVPKPTLTRRRKDAKPLSKDASETLWALSRVYHEALRHYRDHREAVEFLFRPHALLNGRAPIVLAKGSVAGAEAVLDILADAEAGAVV